LGEIIWQAKQHILKGFSVVDGEIKITLKLSVIAFPYPSTFQTCINDAPTSLASCLIAENVFFQ